MAGAVVAFLFLIDTSMNPDGSTKTTNTVTANTNAVVCTADAKLCSDGSYVSRVSPTCAFAQCPPDTNSNTSYPTNSNSNGNTNTTTSSSLRVVFYDNVSGNSIVQTNVELYSDNGTRCVTEPCETNGRTWTGTTDSDGAVLVDASAVDESMAFTLVGYQTKELHAGGSYEPSGYWRLPLIKK